MSNIQDKNEGAYLCMDIQYKNQKQTAKMDFGRRRIDHASLKETLARMKTDYQSHYHRL